MKCGADATCERRKTFSWHPGWVNFLILIGILPWAVVAMILTKRMTIYAPLCDDHRYHWTWRSCFIWFGFALLVLLGIFAIFFLSTQEKQGGGGIQIGGLVCFGTIIAGAVWLFSAAIIHHVGIRAAEITDMSISLTNVSRDFVEALRDERGQRREEDEYERPHRRDWDDDPHRESFRPRDERF
jgi:hypothetical protein